MSNFPFILEKRHTCGTWSINIIDKNIPGDFSALVTTAFQNIEWMRMPIVFRSEPL
jgi:hypothetical protein